jgi:hypothetical protein
MSIESGVRVGWTASGGSRCAERGTEVVDHAMMCDDGVQKADRA